MNYKKYCTMNKEQFMRPKGWEIPTAEIRIEEKSLFAHYDIEKDESMSLRGQTDGEEIMRQESEEENYIACYIRIPHKATLEAIRETIRDNGCENVEVSANAIYELYTQAYVSE